MLFPKSEKNGEILVLFHVPMQFVRSDPLWNVNFHYSLKLHPLLSCPGHGTLYLPDHLYSLNHRESLQNYLSLTLTTAFSTQSFLSNQRSTTKITQNNLSGILIAF